jgi:hypothetical protein
MLQKTALEGWKVLKIIRTICILAKNVVGPVPLVIAIVCIISGRTIAG